MESKIPIVRGRGLEKSYGPLTVLKGVDIDVYPGQIAAIVGPSGAGKSTLLHLVGTLDEPDKGEVTIAGQDPVKLSSKALAAFRNKNIGFIFQFHHLLPEFTALENVMLPGKIAGQKDADVKERAKLWLDRLGMGHRFNHLPKAMSGGEQQRVAVARALINSPAVILADEPSGNLDSKNATSLHQLFFELREKFGQTFIIVTHNDELASMADGKILIIDGQVASNTL